MNQNQQIEIVFTKHLSQIDGDYRRRLNTSVGVIRFLLRQGMAFRGRDKLEQSSNQENYLES